MFEALEKINKKIEAPNRVPLHHPTPHECLFIAAGNEADQAFVLPWPDLDLARALSISSVLWRLSIVTDLGLFLTSVIFTPQRLVHIWHVYHMQNIKCSEYGTFDFHIFFNFVPKKRKSRDITCTKARTHTDASLFLWLSLRAFHWPCNELYRVAMLRQHNVRDFNEIAKGNRRQWYTRSMNMFICINM